MNADATRHNAALVLIMAIAMSLGLGAACSSSDDDSAPDLDDPSATGTELTTEFIEVIRSGDTEALDALLMDSYLVQRADGSSATKQEALETDYDIGDFNIVNVVAVQDGDVLTVSWSLEIDEVIDGEEFTGEAEPRLTVFV